MKNWIAVIYLGLFGAGCGQKASIWADDGRLRVVATVTMVGDLLKEVGGERVQVVGLMGPGVDPHSYKTKISDGAALEGADAVFYSGLHLEGKMQESLEQLAKRRSGVYAVTTGIPKEQLLEPQEDFEGHYDPHVWGDPELWAETVKVAVKGLSEMDPEGASYYEKRGSEYEVKLRELKAWAVKRVEEVPKEKRLLVTSHDAFFYFGQGFGFEVRGLQGVSTVSESGLKARAELVTFIKERGIRTIFPESSVNAKGIKAVAAEARVEASEEELFSDAMGFPGDVVDLHGEQYDKGTYLGMVKHNVNSIVDGLK